MAANVYVELFQRHLLINVFNAILARTAMLGDLYDRSIDVSGLGLWLRAWEAFATVVEKVIHIWYQIKPLKELQMITTVLYGYEYTCMTESDMNNEANHRPIGYSQV